MSISDGNEHLRNLSLRVIRTFIQKYGADELELLLDPVLDGAFSEDHLRRQSCTILMDDILKSVKIGNKEYYEKTVICLYILRNDYVDSIKYQATNTWKANIENTPKTLKKLLKVFIHTLAGIYASSVRAVYEIVHDCVYEFVGKYQEQCLYLVIDHVQSFMEENPNEKWAGVMLLKDILEVSDPDLLRKIQNTFLSLIRVNMSDPNDILRKFIF